MPFAQLLVFFLFWLPSAHPTSAQQSANPPSAVIGIVRTSEGTPVPGATVRLIDTVTNKVWMSWTDQTGKFEFPQIADGKYRIEASQLGFVQSSLVVEVPIVPPGPVPVVLRVATLAELSATPGNPSSNRPSSAGNRQARGQNLSLIHIWMSLQTTCNRYSAMEPRCSSNLECPRPTASATKVGCAGRVLFRA